MCGFAGIYMRQQVDADEIRGTVGRMTATLRHRGPDDSGVFADERVALGHRRLSVLDLTACGAQPMRRGDAVLAYNGEAYNFRELRVQLEQAGQRFRGGSDTEVVLAAYSAWGLQGLARLEGMFALALWDAAAERLVLMRDRLGIKPVFYSWAGGRLVFGSEIKALRAAGAVGSGLDEQALAEYLWYGNAFEDRTIYRDVRTLLPGHWLIVENGATRTEPWWRIEEWLAPPPIRDGMEAAEAVRAAVDTAVARQLVSDVPVALFLSGGIDSSSIAASAALGSERRLTSFAVAFDYDTHANELPKAREVASRFGLDHHELQVSGAGLEDVIHALVLAHDEPFADAANLPLFLLCRALGGAAKVVLQGDGGDEMFGGYRRYSILDRSRLWQAWPAWAAPALASAGGTGRRLARIGAAAGNPNPAMMMALLLTLETLRDPPTQALSAGGRARLQAADPFLAFRRCAQRFRGADPVQTMLLTDITLQLPSQFLPKVDRATMAHGVEARVPLLDEAVASIAVGLPASLKVRGRQKKLVLRQAFRGAVPDVILDGPKTGFGVPYEQWLAGPLHGFARATILEPGVVQLFELDAGWIANALDDHRSRRRNRGFLLWKLLQLALWSKEYLS